MVSRLGRWSPVLCCRLLRLHRFTGYLQSASFSLLQEEAVDCQYRPDENGVSKPIDSNDTSDVIIVTEKRWIRKNGEVYQDGCLFVMIDKHHCKAISLTECLPPIDVAWHGQSISKLPDLLGRGRLGPSSYCEKRREVCERDTVLVPALPKPNLPSEIAFGRHNAFSRDQ